MRGRRIRLLLILIAIPLSAACSLAQQPAPTSKRAEGNPQVPGGADLSEFFQSKIKAEWEALKNKDKNAYGALLADDYEGVEVDGRGERTRIQSINEVIEGNVFNYTLWGFKLIPLGPDAAFLIYEVTLQFPPKSAVPSAPHKRN